MSNANTSSIIFFAVPWYINELLIFKVCKNMYLTIQVIYLYTNNLSYKFLYIIFSFNYPCSLHWKAEQFSPMASQLDQLDTDRREGSTHHTNEETDWCEFSDLYFEKVFCWISKSNLAMNLAWIYWSPWYKYKLHVQHVKGCHFTFYGRMWSRD